jgi:hypothetical protein
MRRCIFSEGDNLKWKMGFGRWRLGAGIFCSDEKGRRKSEETYGILIKLSIIIHDDVCILRRSRLKICVVKRPASTRSEAHFEDSVWVL